MMSPCDLFALHAGIIINRKLANQGLSGLPLAQKHVLNLRNSHGIRPLANPFLVTLWDFHVKRRQITHVYHLNQ
jgi:hypothetical protein